MEMVTRFVTEKLANAEIPAIGDEADVNRAKEIVGAESKVYGALKVPPEHYKTSAKEYCMMCPVPCLCFMRMVTNQTLQKTLYIVTDKTIKVHVDPLEPPFLMEKFKRNIPDIDLDDVKDMKIVEKGGTCFDPRKKRGITFGDSGVEFFISEPEQLQKLIERVQQAKEMAEAGVAKVEALEEASKQAQKQKDGATSSTVGN